MTGISCFNSKELNEQRNEGSLLSAGFVEVNRQGGVATPSSSREPKPGISIRNDRLNVDALFDIEPVSVHYLGPSIDEVTGELFIAAFHTLVMSSRLTKKSVVSWPARLV